MRTVGIPVPLEGRENFDRVDVWRINAGEHRVRLTDLTDTPARTHEPSPEDPSVFSSRRFNLQNTSLRLRVNGTLHTLSFSTDPTGAELADIFAGALPSVVVFPRSGHQVGLRLTAAGHEGTLEVLRTAAAAFLGLQPDTYRGRDAAPALVSNQVTYPVVDPWDVVKGVRYIYQLYESSNPTLRSAFSSPLLYAPPTGTCLLSTQIRYPTGDPRPDLPAVVRMEPFSGNGTYQPEYGFALQTDELGVLRVPLVRGMQGSLSIGSMGISTRFRVPTDVAVQQFDPFDPLYTIEDNAFRVVVPTIPSVRNTP